MRRRLPLAILSLCLGECHILSPAMAATMVAPVKGNYALGVGTMAPGGAPCLFSHTGGNEGCAVVSVALQRASPDPAAAG